MRLNGELRSRDTTVGVVRDGLLAECDEALLPLYLQRTKDIESWLRGRAIDAHRTNSRLLKKALRVGSADDLDAVLRVHAATITDAYWFCREGEGLSYADVRFRENHFAALALRGDPDSFNRPYSHTPELTNIGSYEKCWLLRDGSWWMVKQGNGMERFSELFICRLGQALGFPMAEYEQEGGTVLSPDFTDGAAVNYEAADGIVGDDEDYCLNFDAFYAISPDIARQYLEIIYMDGGPGGEHVHQRQPALEVPEMHEGRGISHLQRPLRLPPDRQLRAGDHPGGSRGGSPYFRDAPVRPGQAENMRRPQRRTGRGPQVGFQQPAVHPRKREIYW